MRLRIGSRGSQLALWQANHVAHELRGRGHLVSVEIIHTTGDKMAALALAPAGTKGVFTKEIEEALERGAIDLAVHSLKDLPTEVSEKFEIAAIPAREDPRDALCSTEYPLLEELPPGARVGTSSLRRQAQLKALRPDLNIHALRGNVDTRLRKLQSGEFDAIVLASAGLHRLGRLELVRHIFPVTVMCPAAGQGALAIEIRRGDTEVRDAVGWLEDASARVETDCERALLAGLGGGCQVPIGASARWRAGALDLHAVIASPDGGKKISETLAGQDAVHLGQTMAKSLLARGGAGILDQVYGKALQVPEQP